MSPFTQSLYSMDRSQWLRELREAEKSPRRIVEEDKPPRLFSEREQCVICDKRTASWLHPENAPLCSDDCLALYLADPSVYDPRELHSRPSPRLVQTESAPAKATAPKPEAKPPRRRKKPGRWEPSDAFIEKIQRDIRRRRGEEESDDS